MRRRYVQQADGSLIEVGLDYVQPALGHDGFIVTDRDDGMRSPIDGSMIDTRAKLREHMRRHDVVHHDEIQPDIERAHRSQQVELQMSRVRDVIDAYRKVEAGYKPKVGHDKGV